MNSDQIAATLNRLIEVCKDGEAAYQTAMQAVEDAHLKHLFSACSQQRASFAEDLQQLVELFSPDEPAQSTTAGAAIRRGWMNLQAAISEQGSRAAILKECERGEDAAVRAYEEAMSHDLPATLREVIESQHRCIVELHDQMRELRDTARAA